MRQIKINTTLGSEIITASEVKNYVRIDTAADDALIATMITQARIWAENFISRDIVSKNRTYYIDRTDTGLFDLPFSPVASISEITINNIITTNYEILGLDNETADRVKITYITSGLNDSLLKQALLQLVSTYYDNRADFIVSQSVSEIPSNVKIVLSSYKTMFL
jgi:hypothetical protein